MPTTKPTSEMLMRAADKRRLAQTCRRYADAYRASGRSPYNAATFAATADKHDIQAACMERGEPVPNWTS